ncbi:MAG: ABC transporter permease, partial [Actinomycetia bacterium]|nr:ABC transporter permease [Actinomycetes bacterium]
MGRVLAVRFGRLLATLFAVTLLSFLMTSLLPGDPAVAILGQDAIYNEELLLEVREDLGLNDPLPVRYLTWLGNAVTGDLGESYTNRGQSVMDTILDRVPVTAQLASMAVLIAVILAVPIGVIGAYKQGRWPDTTSSAAVQVALSVPNFITGIFLIW